MVVLLTRTLMRSLIPCTISAGVVLFCAREQLLGPACAHVSANPSRTDSVPESAAGSTFMDGWVAHLCEWINMRYLTKTRSRALALYCRPHRQWWLVQPATQGLKKGRCSNNSCTHVRKHWLTVSPRTPMTPVWTYCWQSNFRSQFHS